MTRHTRKHHHPRILALDGQYMPMVEISRRKALKAVATGRALVLDLKTWAKLGLVDVASQPFHAIVYLGAKARAEAKMGLGRGTSGILRRDGYRCQYAGCDRRGTTVDHVIPRCQGGPSTWTNLVACCRECNMKKGGRTPEQAGMTLKRPVRTPRAILLDRLQELAGTPDTR